MLIDWTESKMFKRIVATPPFRENRHTPFWKSSCFFFELNEAGWCLVTSK